MAPSFLVPMETQQVRQKFTGSDYEFGSMFHHTHSLTVCSLLRRWFFGKSWVSARAVFFCFFFRWGDFPEAELDRLGLAEAEAKGPPVATGAWGPKGFFIPRSYGFFMRLNLEVVQAEVRFI